MASYIETIKAMKRAVSLYTGRVSSSWSKTGHRLMEGYIVYLVLYLNRQECFMGYAGFCVASSSFEMYGKSLKPTIPYRCPCSKLSHNNYIKALR